MDTTLFLQQIVNGLVAGMSYVLIATGLTLVFGVLRIINFAHGEFYMLGALLTFYVGKLAVAPELPVPEEPAVAPCSPERAARRAETMRVLRHMAGLPAEDPERARIRAEVIEDHMPYARRIARRYGRTGVTDEDFEQVAYLGLVKAVDNFDPEHGTGFLGYATPMIVGEIKRYFRDRVWSVRVPRRLQELHARLSEMRGVLAQELGRQPTVHEVAERLGVDEEDALEAFEALQTCATVPLEAVDDSPAPVGAVDDPALAEVVDRESLRPLLHRLPEREKRILVLRFFRGLSQSQIAAELVPLERDRILRLAAETMKARPVSLRSAALPAFAVGYGAQRASA